jgi:hypothetical protein
VIIPELENWNWGGVWVGLGFAIIFETGISEISYSIGI